MSKLLFFLRAYPLTKRISLALLFLAEATKVSHTRWRSFFNESLIESRSILGFVYDRGGVASAYDHFMLVSFSYKNSSLTMRLRWDSSDFLVFEQVFIKEEYAHLSDTNLLTPVIIDAGANIGCTTIYLKMLYPKARILSIEADPSNFIALEENIRLCGLEGITCVSAAIWNVNGIVRLGRNFRDNRDWSVRVQEQGDIPVSAKTMLTILEENKLERADILKMDIEGAELNIFSEDVTIERVLSTVKFIAIEVHDDVEKKIEKLLTRMGFTVFVSNETLFGKID